MDEEKICRYCFEGESVAKLISPCDCKGSAGYIHKQCVTKWMLLSELTTCELCHAQFRCRPSRCDSLSKTLHRTKQEAICYAVIFIIFMLPVILFKSLADGLRSGGVLTYEESDRLLTGGLFGTYLLLIVFGVLFVAIWVHRCHDDPAADAAVAPVDAAATTEDEGAAAAEGATDQTADAAASNPEEARHAAVDAEMETGATGELTVETAVDALELVQESGDNTIGGAVAQDGQTTRAEVIVHVPSTPVRSESSGSDSHTSVAITSTPDNALTASNASMTSTTSTTLTTLTTIPTTASAPTVAITVASPSTRSDTRSSISQAATPLHSLAAYIFHHRRPDNDNSRRNSSSSRRNNSSSSNRRGSIAASTPLRRTSNSATPRQRRYSPDSSYEPREIGYNLHNLSAHELAFTGGFY